jgi:hypothetical protein
MKICNIGTGLANSGTILKQERRCLMLVSNQSGDFELRVSALSREDVYNMQQALASAIMMFAEEDNAEEIKALALIQKYLVWHPRQVKSGIVSKTPKSSTTLTVPNNTAQTS